MNESHTPLEGSKLANYSPIPSVQNLQIIDVQVGGGEIVQSGANITAHYTGALANNGTIFQSSHDFGNPITFSLNHSLKVGARACLA